MNYEVFEDRIKVIDSYKYTKKAMATLISEVRDLFPGHVVVMHRGDPSLIREWCLHNALYKMGLFKSHTKDVDLDYPQRWYEKMAYFVFGGLVSLFMK